MVRPGKPKSCARPTHEPRFGPGSCGPHVHEPTQACGETEWRTGSPPREKPAGEDRGLNTQAQDRPRLRTAILFEPAPGPAPPRRVPPPGPSTLIGWLRGRARQAGQWERGAPRGTCAPAQPGRVRAGPAPGRGARGEGTRERGGARGGARAGGRADWPTPRSEAVNGGAAGPRLQNKGQAARGAAAGGCLAPCGGANGRSASRAAPAPPESRARANRGPGRMGAAGRGADRRAAVSTGGPGHCCAGGYFVATRGSCDSGRGPEAPVGRQGRRAGRERAAPVDVFVLI